MRWSGSSGLVYLHQQGVGLLVIGWIVGIYGFTWGAAQFFTGRLVRPGRSQITNAWDGSPVPAWRCCRSATARRGGACRPLWPGSAWRCCIRTSSAAVADIAHPNWRLGDWHLPLLARPGHAWRRRARPGCCRRLGQALERLLVRRHRDAALRRRVPLGRGDAPASIQPPERAGRSRRQAPPPADSGRVGAAPDLISGRRPARSRRRQSWSAAGRASEPL